LFCNVYYFVLDTETVYQTQFTMVLTAAQTTAFFEGATQMGIPNATVVQLVNEGISAVDDLSEFDRDSLQQVA
jgi:hypothetical protein